MVDAHQTTRWQVTLASDPTFAAPVYDTGHIGDLLQHTVAVPLSYGEAYIWRAQTDFSESGLSPWSNATSFDTELQVMTLDRVTGDGEQRVTGDGEIRVVLEV